MEGVAEFLSNKRINQSIFFNKYIATNGEINRTLNSVPYIYYIEGAS